ncbi:MAG: hypothetical protein AAF738_10865, partial [Bacteroidota bacterium]
MTIEFGAAARFKCYIRTIQAVDDCGQLSSGFAVQQICVVQPDLVSPQLEIEAPCGTNLDPIEIYNTYLNDRTLYSNYATWLPNFDPTPLGVNVGNLDLGSLEDQYFTDQSGDEFPANPQHTACGYTVSWEDSDRISVCEDGAYKFFRDWTIYNWCDGHLELIDLIPQVIKVNDSKAPKISSSPLQWYQSGSPYGGCTADLVVTIPEVVDVCSENTSLFLSVRTSQDGIGSTSLTSAIQVTPGQTIKVPNVEIGLIFFDFRAVDACGNTSTQTQSVFFFDDITPIAICETTRTISLNTSECIAKVPASVFDDGSYDNCGAVQLSVARMDSDSNGDGLPEATDFRAFVYFSDADLADTCTGTQHVVLRVADLSAYDTNGDGTIDANDNLDARLANVGIDLPNTIDGDGINYNYCIVDVELKESSPPTCDTIPPFSFACTDTLNSLLREIHKLEYNHSDSALWRMTELLTAERFGQLPNVQSCSPTQFEVIAIDFSAYDELCPQGIVEYQYQV